MMQSSISSTCRNRWPPFARLVEVKFSVGEDPQVSGGGDNIVVAIVVVFEMVLELEWGEERMG